MATANAAGRKLRRADREVLALKVPCPNCHSEAGRKCMKRRDHIKNTSLVMPGTAMKTVHPERLALVPGHVVSPTARTLSYRIEKTPPTASKPYALIVEGGGRPVSFTATHADLKALSDEITHKLAERT
jgi:hypothetical protein